MRILYSLLCNKFTEIKYDSINIKKKSFLINRRSFAFLWSQFEKKRSSLKTTKGILNIPCNDVATCLIK